MNRPSTCPVATMRRSPHGRGSTNCLTGPLKMRLANVKSKPCFPRFAWSLVSSHSNSIGAHHTASARLPRYRIRDLKPRLQQPPHELLAVRKIAAKAWYRAGMLALGLILIAMLAGLVARGGRAANPSALRGIPSAIQGFPQRLSRIFPQRDARRHSPTVAINGMELPAAGSERKIPSAFRTEQGICGCRLASTGESAHTGGDDRPRAADPAILLAVVVGISARFTRRMFRLSSSFDRSIPRYPCFRLLVACCDLPTASLRHLQSLSGLPPRASFHRDATRKLSDEVAKLSRYPVG